jgi:hypothetical protein
MSRDAIIPLIFATMFLTPLALGLVSTIVSRIWHRWHGTNATPVVPGNAWRANRPNKADWPSITEFARRRDRFNRMLLATAFGFFLLLFLDLPLTAFAVLVLVPLYGALLHLRCPVCDTTTTLRGVTDGKYCLRCQNRVRY